MTSIITARCRECGKPFIQSRSNQKYCSGNCKKRKSRHSNRTLKRQRGDRYFYGVDGELGLNSQGEEVYQLLGLGNDDHYNYVYNKEGLDWESVFEFLWGEFERDHGEQTVYAGFFLRFDFSQWFKSWPEHKARSLFTTYGKAKRAIHNGKFYRPVRIDGQHSTWYVNGIGERMIRIQKKGSNIKRYMAINDAGPFFQTSLLKAIDPKDWKTPVVSPDEFETISVGKQNRRSVGDSLQELEYNRLENAALCRMLSRYNEGLGEMGIHLGIHQWYGPGQAAQEWFKNIGLPSTEDFAKVLGPMWDVYIESYYGGWFEVMMHGLVKGFSYEYDINSAYPSVMRNLPCIMHGTWCDGSGEPDTSAVSYTLVRAKVKGQNPYIGAMLHRVQQGTGISRPRNTAGVYWWHELVAARKAGLIDEIIVDNWWTFTPECNCPCPLAAVADLYEQRLDIGKNSAAGKAFKLIYNSAYGKLAQSVGSSHFANPFYASLITAGCRIQILEAIASHPLGPKGVIMIATDAVFFTEPHPTLPLSNKLGEWGHEIKEDLWIFKPGHYWDKQVRKDLAEGKHAQFKARGVNARDFSAVIDEVCQQFQTLFKKVALRSFNADWNTNPLGTLAWPRVTYIASFSVVTIGQALAWNDWSRCGEIIKDAEVGPIDSDPFRKRDGEFPYLYHDRRARFAVIRSPNYERAWNGKSFEDTSTPYSRRFGLAREEQWEGATIITPDGDMGTLILNALGQGK